MNTQNLETLPDSQHQKHRPGVPTGTFADLRKLLQTSIDAALTVEQVCELLQVSKSWVYSSAGKEVLGTGFKLGGSRRYRASVIAAVLGE